MHLPLLTHRAGFRALTVVVVALATVALLVRPSAGRTLPRVAAPAGAASAGALLTPPQGGVVIQVRDFPSSPIIFVVAWNAANPAFGLSSVVRRSGATERYHRLWVSIDWPSGRDVSEAQGLNRPLPVTSQTETQNCFKGTCTPGTTFGARIPDGPFRAAKEDLPVKFILGSGGDFTITMRRGLIDAYLATIDSVVASLKK